jgi:hypothetical protein
VDLPRGEVGGRALAELRVIIFLALRKAPGAFVAGRARRDRIPGGEQGLVAVAERAGQSRARLADQPLLLGIGDLEPVHLGLEVGEDRARRAVGEGRAGQHPAGVGAHRLEVELRREDAELRLVADVRGDLTHRPVDVAQPRDIGLGVGRIVDPVLVDQEDRELAERAAIVGDREAMPEPAHPVVAAGDLVLEQAVADPRLRPQPGEPEAGMHLGKLPVGERELLPRAGLGIIVEPVVADLAAELGLALGAERRRGIEGLVEKGVQPCILDLGRGWRGGGTPGMLGGRGAGRGGEETGEQELWFHGADSLRRDWGVS